MARMNKTKAVMFHLVRYGSITSWEAIKEYGATRLSAIIYNLRYRYDMNIVNQEIRFRDRFGTLSSFVKYVLVREENKDYSGIIEEMKEYERERED